MTPPTVMHWPAPAGSGGSGPWTPSSSTDVFAWWDSSSLTSADTTTNANGDEALLEWFDETASIPARTFDYATKSDRGPILISGTQNGNAVLEQATVSSLNGSLTSQDLGISATATKITMASVTRNSSPSTTGFIYSGGLMSSVRDGSGAFVRVGWSDQGSGQISGTHRRPFFFTSGANTRYSPGSVVSGVDQWKVYVATFDLATGACALFVDGTSVDSGTLTPIGSISMSTVRVSAFGNTSYDFYRKSLNGSQGGTFVFASAISTSLRQNLEGYLAHKWGLAGNLPVSHPYKSTAP